MKRLLIILALVVAAALPTLADCQHYKVQVSQVDGKMKFVCDTCKTTVNYKEWKQTERDFGFTLADPYLNYQADVHDIGAQQLMVNCTNQMEYLWLMRDEDERLIYYQDMSSKPSGFAQVDLPWYETKCHITLVALLKVQEQVSLEDGKTSMVNNHYFAVQHLEQKPLHRFYDFTAREVLAPDSDMVAHPFTRLTFAIKFPADEDVMPEDKILLYRSKTPDFANAEVLTSFDFSAYTKKEGNYAWFEYDDKAEEATYNTTIDLTKRPASEVTAGVDSLIHNDSFSKVDQQILEGFYTHPNRPMYYRLARATVGSLWPSHEGQFAFSDSVNLSRQLPSVSKVEVKPGPYWAQNKKSTVKVHLHNPQPWEYNDLENSTLIQRFLQGTNYDSRRYMWSTDAQIRVKRFSPQSEWDGGKDVAAMEYLIKGSDVKWNRETHCWEAELEDCQALPYTHYYYTAEVEAGTSLIPLSGNNNSITSSETDAELCYSKVAALINNFTATQGTIPGKVSLEWKLGVGQVDKISLMRRERSKNRHTEWEALEITDPKMREYLDETALAGHAYEYKIQTLYAVRSIEIVDSAIVRGWGSFRSILTGRVTMPNGTAMAGEKVTLTRRTPVFIDDVVDDDGAIIMYGFHDGVVAETRPQELLTRRMAADDNHTVVTGDTIYSATVTTDERGYFEFTDLPYMGDGTTYRVNFTRPYNYGGVPLAEVEYTLSNNRPEVKDQRYVCADVATFSGNVVYTESTVPVMDANFLLEYKDVDGKVLSSAILRDTNGNPIRTDANGAFAFTVPAGKLMSIRATKGDHKFSGNGCLLVDNKEVFTPVAGEKYVIPQVGDATRVRLVGRLAGGHIQGNKQLGFSKSQNNLGDDLTMELQLEGNNTSWLVFRNDRPDDTTIKTTVKHPVKVLTYEPQTQVTYEKKRIVIHPDVKTGEFFVDLIPAKYRISQLTAMGYPTLYQSGESLQVIDLGDSTTLHTMVSENDRTLTYQYNATYKRTYHVTPTLTYNQFRNGVFTGYLGEPSVSRNDIVKDSLVTYEVAAYDRLTDKATYAFGYPVFSAERSYQLQAYAHEDFHYNNNPLGECDEVPIENGMLHVQNGLLNNNQRDSYQLDANGRTNIVFTTGGPIFGLTGEKAVRAMNLSVELNGLYVEAEPLKAFVLGHRTVGENAVPMVELDTHLENLDVLRDPPGKSSYAYREAGTTYSWNKSALTQRNTTINIKFAPGASVKFNAGVGWIAESHFNVSEIKAQASGAIVIPCERGNDSKYGQYTMKLNERIQTSSDAFEQGAMADVYIGVVKTNSVYSTEAYTVLDEQDYQLVKTNVDNGVFKLISSGTDSKGEKRYLVVNRCLAVTPGIKRSYIHTQRYIVGTLIPELERQREQYLKDGDGNTKEQLQERANASGRVFYLRMPSDSLTYTAIYPQDPTKTYIDSVKVIDYNIAEWQRIIRENEEEKVNFLKNGTPFKSYTISGPSVDYSESSTYYYTKAKWTGSMKPSGTFGVGVSGGKGDEDKEKNKDDSEVDLDEDGDLVFNKGKNKNHEVSALGFIFSFDFSVTSGESVSGSFNYSKTLSNGYGYKIAVNDNSYMDVDVYGHTMSPETLKYAELAFIQKGKENEGKDDQAAANIHNFVFAAKGGATRNPWLPVDYTLYYRENGQPVALGSRMLKIDNPRIYVDHPVVNNQPEDESAIIKVRLVNETEINDKTSLLAPSKFSLKVDESSNPNGAEFYIDGAPLSQGKDIRVAPGQSVEKTLKINRGVGYNFENLKLVFADQSAALDDKALVSIHYLPVASPINISSPEDKWTMNTLSPCDDRGYYIPVNIDGFNVNSDGFHHLELQYKKKTDGESRWTQVCAFYNDSTLYREATGEKHMIPESGRINDLKFYGEKDPMEMEYDLRAVAFRKYGTGFLTRASNVMSGKKDTSNPRMFGSPKPANGILTYADVISIPFNEPIAYNYLDKIANFQVTGRTNNSNNSYPTALFFPASIMRPQNYDLAKPECQDSLRAFYKEVNNVPCSKVKVNMNGNDFTLDMMVRVGSNSLYTDGANLFSLRDKDLENENDHTSSSTTKNQYMLLSLLRDQSLRLNFNGVTYLSERMADVDFTELQRVGVTFTHEPKEGDPQVRFYINGVERKVRLLHINGTSFNDPADIADKANFTECNAYGQVILGESLNGASMADVRLWNRALPPYEITQKRNKYVHENELGLVGYWPLDEGTGHVAYDVVNGADLYFTRQSWQNTEKQFSLKLNQQALELKAEDINRPASYDYTVSLWARADHLATDSVSLLTTGDPMADFFRLGTQQGHLTLTTISEKGAEPVVHHITAIGNFADEAWHHMAIVANKSQNLGAIYYDGNLVETFAGTSLGGLQNYNVRLGDQNFTGHFDNLQVWDHAYPANSIATLQKRAASGFEMGLLLNLPFEQTLVNEQGSRYTAFSPLNTVYRKKESTNNYLPMDTVIVATPQELTNMADMNYSSPAQAITGEKNIDFDWTSTSNELQIHLLATDSEINRQNVNVVVRGVEDLAGNSMLNPVHLMLYVNKNVVAWKDKQLNLTTKYGKGLTHKVKFENISGLELYYTIHEFCGWLDANQVEGYISPLAEQEVILTTHDDLAPGTYNTALYLRDENDLVCQLPIQLTVEAEEPEWEVTTNPDYNQLMNLIGQIALTNDGGETYLDNDKRDIVYAFYGNDCIGKTHVAIQNDAPFVFMTILGKPAMNGANGKAGAPISFRLWRASTGNVTYLSSTYNDAAGNEQKLVRFAQNTIVGTHSDPVKLSESDIAVQNFSLKKGWNWISLGVRPDQNEGVNKLFVSTDHFTPGDIINTMGGAEPSYMQTNGMWSDGKDGLPYDTCNVYQIYVHNDCTASVVGWKFDDAGRKITLKNSGWNNLAYLQSTSLPISIALADYMASGEAKDRAVVMSRNQFAQIEGGKWYGSLEYLHPGQGYYIYHLGKPGTVIHYYDGTVNKSERSSRKQAHSAEAAQGMSREHITSMGVVAAIAATGDFDEADQLVAYAADQEVGRATAQVLPDGRCRYFITLSAEPGAEITWAQERGGRTMAKAKSAVRYAGTTVAGTISEPLLIDFANGFDSADSTTYFTTDGIMASPAAKLQRQVLLGTDGSKVIK